MVTSRPLLALAVAFLAWLALPGTFVFDDYSLFTDPAVAPLDAWRQWFDVFAVEAPDALCGPRYELFSMLASAAVCGLGVALMPAMLVQAELARNDLVILCNRPARSRRSYCFVSPESAEPATALSGFVEWLQDEIAADALCAPKHG